MTLPREAVPHFRGLATKLATFAISASKHGGLLVNEFFIYSEDMALSPGYLKGGRIFKMTAVALGPKVLSRTRVQGSQESSLILRRYRSFAVFVTRSLPSPSDGLGSKPCS